MLAAESPALSTAGYEKGTTRHVSSYVDFEPAYNLLINLILSSTQISTLLPQVIYNLATPPPFPQGPALSIAVLTTIFNVIPNHPSIRFQVFRVVLAISQEYNLYDYISPYFPSVNEWLADWEVSEEDRADVWKTIISMAEKADDRYRPGYGI
jgi:translation initiation factor 3 subunit M